MPALLPPIAISTPLLTGTVLWPMPSPNSRTSCLSAPLPSPPALQPSPAENGPGFGPSATTPRPRAHTDATDRDDGRPGRRGQGRQLAEPAPELPEQRGFAGRAERAPGYEGPVPGEHEASAGAVSDQDPQRYTPSSTFSSSPDTAQRRAGYLPRQNAQDVGHLRLRLGRSTKGGVLTSPKRTRPVPPPPTPYRPRP
jgi:hypothetical protein